jgi:hypothetical protein
MSSSFVHKTKVKELSSGREARARGGVFWCELTWPLTPLSFPSPAPLYVYEHPRQGTPATHSARGSCVMSHMRRSHRGHKVGQGRGDRCPTETVTLTDVWRGARQRATGHPYSLGLPTPWQGRASGFLASAHDFPDSLVDAQYDAVTTSPKGKCGGAGLAVQGFTPLPATSPPPPTKRGTARAARLPEASSRTTSPTCQHLHSSPPTCLQTAIQAAEGRPNHPQRRERARACSAPRVGSCNVCVCVF